MDVFNKHRDRETISLSVTSVGFLGPIFAAIVALQVISLLTGRYPPFELSAAMLVILQAYLIRRYSLLSTPSLFGALLIYPNLVPFISTYIFEVPIFAIRGQQFQTPTIVDKVVFLCLLGVGVFTVALELVLSRQTGSVSFIRRYASRYRIQYQRAAFVTIGCIYLCSVYLTTPGPTLLTVDYVTVLNNYKPWANFAGSLFVGSWIVLFLMTRKEDYAATIYQIFLILTAIGLIWLLLHSRRNESLGVMAVLAVEWASKVDVKRITKSLRAIIAAAVFGLIVLVQVFIEQFRGGGPLELPNYANEVYATYPGGGHNIYGTFQATVSLFTYEHPHFYGKTFLLYPIQGIPTGVYALFDLPYPALYAEFLGSQYSLHLGGSYILNVYYANFGAVGIIIGSLILAWIAAFVRGEIRVSRRQDLMVGLAAILLAGSFRVFWYTHLAWIDHAQGFIAAVLVYLCLVNGLPELRDTFVD